MIKRIKKIRNLGLFRDFTAAEALTDFAKFNLVYGWNGSGKTTLSRLFAMLGKKSHDEHYADCEFEVVLSDDTVFKSNNLDKFTEYIAVFNQQFIEDNLDWKKQGARRILVLSEEKIAEREQYLELRDKKLPKKKAEVDACAQKASGLEDGVVKFLADSARNIKQSYQLIDTADRRYMNYDRTKMRNFIDANNELINNSTSILSDSALEELRKKTYPIFKEKIEATFERLDVHSFVEQQKTISQLLETGVTSQAVERLRLYQDINNWVQDGLAIHHQHNSTNCEFCAQALPKQRLAELNNHFSNAYQVLVESLNGTLNWVNAADITPEIPDSANIYEEFKTEFVYWATEHKKQADAFRTCLSNWQRCLEQKIKNVFDTGIRITGDIAPIIELLNKSIDNLNELISKHNAKAARFEEEQAENKNRLELHYVARAIRDQNYFGMLQQIADEQAKLTNLRAEFNKLEKDKQTLEAQLANAAIAADQFNADLARFLGRSDISLVYDEKETGYRIMRANGNANHLSEGEKTAIAFVFFATKLKENGNRVEDTIVVVDDPVSSFDSNYLFHSYSFLKASCEKAKQLFVLTHNFQYFKMVREWVIGKNKYEKTAKSQLFQIDVVNGATRESAINNAHKTLLDTQSEYQFFFRKLYTFKDAQMLNLENAYEIANYARKLLEAFLSFKRPKHRSNFYQHMLDACLKAGVDQTVVDRVFKFINAYSHDQKIEFDHSSVDNLLAEGTNITNDVLAIIEKLDETHYKELVEVCA